MLIFAHRGASGLAPENTLKAIQLALEESSDAIEIDLHEVDGKIVILHDRWLHSTTSGKGLVHKQRFEYIEQLTAGQGEKIPTLDEIFSLVAGRCQINLELKGIENTDLLLDYIDNAIAKKQLKTEDLILSSFDHQLLYRINQLRPEFLIGALAAAIPLSYAEFASQLNAYSIHLNVNFISQAFVKDAKKRGLKVFVYTVDEPEDILMMKALEVDGIFANFPARARRFCLKNKDSG